MMDSVPLGFFYQPQSGRMPTIGTDHSHNIDASFASSSYEVWNNFFLSAGIPASVANDYAVTFSQHRIKIDMLKDITKEILLDMGIKAMGDIIAILRHAKDICAQDELKNTTTNKVTPRVTSNTINVVPPRSQPNQRQMPQHLPGTPAKSAIKEMHSTSTLPNQIPSNNKIQSSLSLSSGALVSVKQRYKVDRQRVSNSDAANNNNKRPHTNISDSLAKRLKPSPVKNDPRFTEKTLTVILPSTSAAQRLNNHTNLNSNGMISNRNQLSGSIKSRLGAMPDSALSGSDSSTLLTSSASRIKSKQTDLRSSLKSTSRLDTSSVSDKPSVDTRRGQTSNHARRYPDEKSRRDRNHQQKSRSRSDVFERLR